MLTLFSLFFVDFGLGDLELMPRTLVKGKVRVVELFYYIRTFTNVILSFFCKFQIWRLEIDAQDSWKR